MTKLFLTVAAATIMFAVPAFADNHDDVDHTSTTVATEVMVDADADTVTTEECVEMNDDGEEVSIECDVETETMHNSDEHDDASHE